MRSRLSKPAAHVPNFQMSLMELIPHVMMRIFQNQVILGNVRLVSSLISRLRIALVQYLDKGRRALRAKEHTEYIVWVNS